MVLGKSSQNPAYDYTFANITGHELLIAKNLHFAMAAMNCIYHIVQLLN